MSRAISLGLLLQIVVFSVYHELYTVRAMERYHGSLLFPAADRQHSSRHGRTRTLPSTGRQTPSRRSKPNTANETSKEESNPLQRGPAIPGARHLLY